jgi:hypothetical protein
MGSDTRAFVFDRLKTVAAVGGRVLQQGSALTAQTVKPYLVYHMGNDTDEGMSDEDNFKPNRQFMQVFIHVAQGDYGPIDDIMPQVKAALASGVGKPNDLIHVQYLETSQDLQDDLLQSFFRYMRFQLIQAR